MTLRICNSRGAILIALALMQPLRACAAPDPMTETKTAINHVVALLKDRSLESYPKTQRQRLDDAIDMMDHMRSKQKDLDASHAE